MKLSCLIRLFIDKSMQIVHNDIHIGFISVLYGTDPVVVAPMPFAENAGQGKQTQASALCKAQDSDARVPDRDELSSMFYNMNLIGNIGDLWSGSIITLEASGTAWLQSFGDGVRYSNGRSRADGVRCVRR